MIFKNIKMQFAWLITFYLFCFLISVFTFLYDNVMGSVIAFRCTHLSMTLKIMRQFKRLPWLIA